jgi:tRNA U38,U39,U40 pseudouridine synthase TruA
MIRRMVGAAVTIASHDTIPVDYIQEIVKLKNPNNPLPQAPARGLLLHNIEYQKDLV